MKMAIYIRNPEEFAKGEFNYSLSITTLEHWDWWTSIGSNESDILLAVVDVDVKTDMQAVTEKAVGALKKRETEIRAKAEAEVNDLKRRQSELLAITYNGENNE